MQRHEEARGATTAIVMGAIILIIIDCLLIIGGR
jgi:hypothetical protein